METGGLEEGHFMKKVFGTLALLSFLYTLGVVGGVEQNTMSLGVGVIHMGVSVGLFWLFCKLSGAFYPAPSRKRKAADGTGTSINGKRKCSV